MYEISSIFISPVTGKTSNCYSAFGRKSISHKSINLIGYKNTFDLCSAVHSFFFINMFMWGPGVSNPGLLGWEIVWLTALLLIDTYIHPGVWLNRRSQSVVGSEPQFIEPPFAFVCKVWEAEKFRRLHARMDRYSFASMRIGEFQPLVRRSLFVGVWYASRDKKFGVLQEWPENFSLHSQTAIRLRLEHFRSWKKKNKNNNLHVWSIIRNRAWLLHDLWSSAFTPRLLSAAVWMTAYSEKPKVHAWITIRVRVGWPSWRRNSAVQSWTVNRLHRDGFFKLEVHTSMHEQ